MQNVCLVIYRKKSGQSHIFHFNQKATWKSAVCVCDTMPCKKVNWDFNVVEFQSHATDKTW